MLRQWMVLRMLSARRYGATVREIAEETGASQKSIRRDLELLQQAGFAIQDTKGERGRKSWKCSEANGQPAVSFNLTELASLYLGRRFPEPLAGTDFWQGRTTHFGRFGRRSARRRFGIWRSSPPSCITRPWGRGTTREDH